MIEQFVAEYSGSFADYDVAAIRGSIGKLDAEIDKLFDALLNGDGKASDEEGPTTDGAIQAAIAKVRTEHGDEAGNFYDAAYGCALTERMGSVMDIDPVFGRTG